MKITYLKRGVLLLSLAMIMPLVSCSSDSKDAPNQETGDSSYTLTIEGGGTYSNSWSPDSEAGAIVSTHNKNLEGDQNIALIISDDVKDVNVSSALMLNTQTMQPLALGNLESATGEHSNMLIKIGDINYMSNSGSVTLSNLAITPLNEYTGFASFTLAINGKFDNMQTEEVEQIQITGTVKSAKLF